jgi:hypothetical protein
MSDLIEIAAREKFTLYHRPQASTDAWTSLKLTANYGRKRNWWLGWNGQRVARNTDTKNLSEHHPEILIWIVHVLTEKALRQ